MPSNCASISPTSACSTACSASTSSIFGLKFERVEPPYKWVADLQLYAVSDAKTGEPLGLFYLDMFPREGKYNHFAQFGIIEGKLLARRQIPAPDRAR